MEVQSTLDKEIKSKEKPNGVEDDIGALKTDFESLKKNVGSLMGSMKDIAEEKAGEGAEMGRDFAHDASESMRNFQAGIEKQIRRKPLTSIGVAVGVGALLAVLSRR